MEKIMTFHFYDKVLPEYSKYFGHHTADGVVREIKKHKSSSEIFNGLVEKIINNKMHEKHKRLKELATKISSELKKECPVIVKKIEKMHLEIEKLELKRTHINSLRWRILYGRDYIV
jgi:hypothetical protein